LGIEEVKTIRWYKFKINVNDTTVFSIGEASLNKIKESAGAAIAIIGLVVKDQILWILRLICCSYLRQRRALIDAGCITNTVPSRKGDWGATWGIPVRGRASLAGDGHDWSHGKRVTNWPVLESGDWCTGAKVKGIYYGVGSSGQNTVGECGITITTGQMSYRRGCGRNEGIYQDHAIPTSIGCECYGLLPVACCASGYKRSWDLYISNKFRITDTCLPFSYATI